MVNLTRIYTRTGDDGTTRAGRQSQVTKTDPGWRRTPTWTRRTRHRRRARPRRPGRGRRGGAGEGPERPVRRRCRPRATRSRPDPAYPPAADHPRSTSNGSRRTATPTTSGCEPLRSFVLPGGTPGAALLHAARTVVRRAERAAWAAWEEHADTMNQRRSVPQPAVGSAVHPGPGGQRRPGRRAVAVPAAGGPSRRERSRRRPEVCVPRGSRGRARAVRAGDPAGPPPATPRKPVRASSAIASSIVRPACSHSTTTWPA